MVLGLPFAHIPSHFAEDRRRGHDIDAVDLGQVHTAHAKQLSAQVELRSISFLLLEPPFPLLFWQRGTFAPVFSLLQILLDLSIALEHLLLAKLVTILLLLQHKQQVFLPVALQAQRDLVLARLHPRVTKLSQLMRIAFAGQNGVNDRLSSHSAQRHSAHWPIEYSSASAPFGSAGCAALPLAPDHCAAASTFASSEFAATAGTNCAKAHRCAASSAIDSPARRFCAPADSSSPAHSPGTLPNPPLRECRIPRSSTRPWTASQRSESRIASAIGPSPLARLWCTRTDVPVGYPASGVQPRSGIRCRYQCPRHPDVPLPS